MLSRGAFSVFSRCTTLLCVRSGIHTTAVRGRARWLKNYLRDLYNRRLIQGPEPERHRSKWLNWNYDAELFSFGKRLGENFNEATLKVAFTHRSYIDSEEKKRQQLEVEGDTVLLGLQDNTQLAANGETITSRYIKAYLRHSLPALPEEGISAIQDYLMADEMLAYIAANLGVKDIILCEEFPPSTETMSKTLKAIIGALAEDQGDQQAHLFVQDFVLTQLIGRNLSEMWKIVNPMGVLADILQRQGREPPEPRLLWATGMETPEAAYMVGIYSNKQLIGKAPGETAIIAEEMAARDSLETMFGLTDSREPFKFGQSGRTLDIDLNKKNTKLSDFAAKMVQSS